MDMDTSMLWLTGAALLLAMAVQAEYNFDNSYYNQVILDQLDDYFTPWRYDKDDGDGRRDRPRFRNRGGVMVARWYPTQGREPAQYQWSWEVPPGVNKSEKMWWQPYYEPYREYGNRNRYYGGYYYGRRRRYPPGYYRYPPGYSRYPRGYSSRYPSGTSRYPTGSTSRYPPSYRRRNPLSMGFGVSASWSGSQSELFERLRTEPRRAAAPPPNSTEPSPEGTLPPPDAEEFARSIDSLPEATEEDLYGEDEHPGYSPYQEQICCGHYDEANLMREDRIREECYNRVFNNSWARNDYDDGWNQFSCDATEEIKNKIRCVHRCMWKLRGTFDDKYNRFTGRKLREYYRSTENQIWRRDVQDRAVTKCLPNFDPNRNRPERPGQCSRVYLDFSFCLWQDFHANCPDSEWNGRSRYCNRVRRYLKSHRREFD